MSEERQATIASVEDHPGSCAECDDVLIVRGGMVGCLDGAAVCSKCLMAASPQLGWALVVIEKSCVAIGGKWPSADYSMHFSLLLLLIGALVDVYGPLTRRNRPANRLLVQLRRESRVVLPQSSPRSDSEMSQGPDRASNSPPSPKP